MIDSCYRKIDYMRISITDRCNLRCKYCMPHEQPFIPHEDILRYEEIVRICEVATKLDIRHIKVTGGEPLVRRGCVDLIAALKRIPGIEHVTLTTNGVLLGEHLGRLKEIGLDGINISLNALDSVIYERITGSDVFHKAWAALQEALRLGFQVKLNCVPLVGHNDSQILPIAELARTYPMDIRFIEMMPIGYGQFYEPIQSRDIYQQIKKVFPDLHEDVKKRGFGPAHYYTSDREKLKGSIGFIDAMSHSFCASCNRVRLTSEGFLKLCLYHDKGLSLRDLLRSGADNDTIRTVMREAISKKPNQHDFHSGIAAEESRMMSQIGG